MPCETQECVTQIKEDHTLQNEDGTTTRSRRKLVAVGAVGVAGIIGGMTAGAGMFAGAATTTPVYNSELSQCANPSAPVPGAPVFSTRFTVGSGKVSGTIPVIPAATLAANNITPTLVNVTATTQYNSGRSGGNKTDVVTLNLPGHQYSNPLLFNIPPVSNQVVVGTGTVAYSAKTTGKAFATVTINEFIVQATSTVPAVVLGTTCPTGTTKVGSLSGQNFQAPAAPSAVTATPGGSTVGTGPNGTTDPNTAPNNGAATVKFTPSVNNGTLPAAYVILATDTTTANQRVIEGDVAAPNDPNSTAQVTGFVSGLNTNDAYTFQVFAISDHGVSGAASAATTPAIKPAVETVVAPTTAQGARIQQAQALAKK